MPGWFDLYDWPIEVGATDDRTQKLQGIETIRREVVRLQTEHGIDASRIVVGGFSQGGAVALLAAYHPQHGISSSIHQSSAASAAASSGSSGSSLAGCASLSAWLTLVDDVKDLPDAVKQTPLFWAHGQYDDKVLFDHQAFGVEKLREQGVSSIDARQYPMGHESDPQEIVALAGFLDKVIFGDGGRDEL